MNKTAAGAKTTNANENCLKKSISKYVNCSHLYKNMHRALLTAVGSSELKFFLFVYNTKNSQTTVRAQ